MLPNTVSVACPACGRAIDVDSYEIDTVFTRQITTHGEVLVGLRGRYQGPGIRAKRITVYGTLDAQFECEELILGKIAQLGVPGKFRMLSVVAGSRVVLEKPMEVEEARIFGHLEIPKLRVRGRVTVGRGGELLGRVEAESVLVEPGGKFDGDVEILRAGAR